MSRVVSSIIVVTMYYTTY